MKNKQLLWLAIGLQCLVLMGMFVKNLHPLLHGKEVNFLIEPRDPRDYFRGQYSILNYEFSTLSLNELPNDIKTLEHNLDFGDKLYLELKADKNEFYSPAGLWQKPPQGGVPYLKVIVKDKYMSEYDYIDLTAGLESYFTNKEKAEEIDNMFMNRNIERPENTKMWVVVALTDAGDARIKRIEYKIEE
ncbi:MAG: GDYXXLXY domain-containing protein [Bernardetiaceae bacterium]|nr:GDYXXLXY domain-containing protein [Bernardetiaceae bacterium]